MTAGAISTAAGSAAIIQAWRDSRRGVSAILGGLFEMNGKLGDINDHVRAIRILLEDGDEEEKDSEDDGS